MRECVVLVPVLARPWRVAPLVRSLRSSLVNAQARAVFVVCQSDREERDAIERAGAESIVVPWERMPGDYARKINRGVALTEEPWIFLGADDLRFESGWLDLALGCAAQYRARVVGTNDRGNPAVRTGRHSTHTLVARSYIEELGTIDKPGIALHEGYDHQFVDNEFIETAQHRAEFAFSRQAIVEHLHPHWGKAPDDRTYALALAQMEADRDLFRSRRRRWRGGRRSHANRVRSRR